MYAHTVHTEEKLQVCPYDRNHKVRPGYLPYHIVKCMKNYPNHVTCPYNTAHRMSKEHYAAHVKSCLDQDKVGSIKIREEYPQFRGFVSETPIHVGNSKWNTEEEDWSQEV